MIGPCHVLVRRERIKQLQSDIRNLDEKVILTEDLFKLQSRVSRVPISFSSLHTQTANMSRAAKLTQQLSEEEVSQVAKCLC